MHTPPQSHTRLRLSVAGRVQGVGFRPFVYRLALRHGLAGFVRNDVQGACIEVEGPAPDLSLFSHALRHELPSLARIDRLDTQAVPVRGDRGFRITDSETTGQKQAGITPDSWVCPDCLGELLDPTDRRYRYPFINCTNCGPRYSIVEGIPYDRPNTTMRAFPMCPACQAEYDDPASRRFHAQPNACPVCGPRIWLTDPAGTPLPTEDVVADLVAALQRGRIAAIRGVGGFHLAVIATDDDAAQRLRRRKRREHKPLAVMARDTDAVAAFAEVGPAARDLLESVARPIVLLPKRPRSTIAPAVAPRNGYLGVMLPYTPIHYLMFERGLGPIVLTSANFSEEPVLASNDEALAQLANAADVFLLHDREIAARCDDSVVRVQMGQVVPIRRSRGYVPDAILLRHRSERSILAVGGELKNTVCLLRGDRAVLSPHVGDLKNHPSLCFFERVIDHLLAIHEFRLDLIACDLHPQYVSTVYARGRQDVPCLAVQHHHAHVVSCMADNQITGRVIALVCDGTGYGPDQATWGGEFMVADEASYRRLGHLRYMPMPGGDQAAVEIWRMALAYLHDAFGDGAPAVADRLLAHVDPDKRRVVFQMLGSPRLCPPTSSMGRLFDSVSALCRIATENLYEGQAPMELEGVADPSQPDAYAFELTDNDGQQVADARPVIRAVVEDLLSGRPVDQVAGRFHNAVAQVLVVAAQRLRDATGLDRAVLSGGVFQNQMLLEKLVPRLRRVGLSPYWHHRVPANDGGVALGQAVAAAAQQRDRSRP